MPEGDTIAQLARRLSSTITDEAVISTITRDPRLVGVTFDGDRVANVASVGKYLLLRFDSGVTLYSHLHLDGEWRFGDRQRLVEWRRRVELEFPTGVLTGVDVPELGVVSTSAEDDIIGHLGPDLCGATAVPPEMIADRLVRDPATPLAGALLDQRRVAGFGNVFAVELPFLAGVAPFVPVGTIDGLPELARVGSALIRWSAQGRPRNTTGTRLGTADHYLYANATNATAEVGHRYRRTGGRCRVCGDYVAYADADHTDWRRISWWCPTCQSADDAIVDSSRLRRLLALHPALRTDT